MTSDDAMRDARRLGEKLHRQMEIDAAKFLGGGSYVRVTPAMRLKARVASTLRERAAGWLRALADRIDGRSGEEW